ncbi:thiamine ABC transporter substrate-binding protein, partial [Streptomyces sp. TRM76130]|nr:thiamine ABC transporter substrate-binding protein [Streptomyces sp. TRM76130]
MHITKKAASLVVGLGLVTLSACGSSSGDQASGDSKTVTLVSHDSWAVSESVIAA